MDYVLENGENPNQYIFAKLNGFTEARFWWLFGTIESLEKEFKIFFRRQSITSKRQLRRIRHENKDVKFLLLSLNC
jgi:hypothetical protein